MTNAYNNPNFTDGAGISMESLNQPDHYTVRPSSRQENTTGVDSWV